MRDPSLSFAVYDAPQLSLKVAKPGISARLKHPELGHVILLREEERPNKNHARGAVSGANLAVYADRGYSARAASWRASASCSARRTLCQPAPGIPCAPICVELQRAKSMPPPSQSSMVMVMMIPLSYSA